MNAGSDRKVWDAVADAYDAERASDFVYTACLDQVVADLKAHGRVLDAGCGTGLQTRLIRADEILAVDYSPRSLEILKQRLPQVRTFAADIRELPFPDGHLDCVLCANTLQHLNADGQRRAAAELMRVLKPSGNFSVSVHHFSAHKRRAGWIKEGKPGQPGIDYVYRFSRAEVAELFPDARIRAVGFYGWPGKMQRVLALAGHLLARAQHGHMLIAHGKKPMGPWHLP